VLVVGMASGITAGSVVLQDAVLGIDVLEIEPKVLEASHFFDEVNGRPLQDPRVRAIANDARNHLHRHPGRYDVIINEPSNPWISGVSNLFTREFLELGKERLAEDGVFVQWTHTYGMASRDLRSVVRTFAEVYAHVMVFATIEDADVILLGSGAPLRARVSEISAYLAKPGAAADLQRVGVREPYDLLSFLLMDRPAALVFGGDAPLNTDDNAHLEFSAPLYLHYATQNSNNEHLLAARPPFLQLGRDASVGSEGYLVALGTAFERVGRWTDARDCYLEALALDPRSADLRARLDALVEKSAED
jgi:spermidine synthase